LLQFAWGGKGGRGGSKSPHGWGQKTYVPKVLKRKSGGKVSDRNKPGRGKNP